MREGTRWIDKTGLVGGGLFALALGIRLLYLWQSASGPTFGSPVVDSETYDRLARSLVGGGGLTHEFFWQPVFYPLFLSTVYAVTGSSIVAAKLLQAVVGAATSLLSFRLGDRVFGRSAGVLAGLIVAAYGPAVFFDGELLATGWAGFWSVALLLVLLRTCRSPSAAAWLALGLCGALGTITRPTLLPFVVAGCAWAGWRAHRSADGRRVAGRLALALVGFAAVTLPVAVGSHAYTGRFSFLPASAGLNLHIGNNAESARTIVIRPGSDWSELTNSPRRDGVTERRETGRYFRGQVLDYALANPAGFLGGLFDKSAQFLCSRELPRNVDLYLLREDSSLLGALVWKLGAFGFPFGLLLSLAAAGVVLCYEKIPPPLRWYLLLYPSAVVLVFVSARYRTPVVPVLAVIAAGAVFELPRARAAAGGRRLMAAAAAAAFSLLVGTLPGPFPQEQVNYRAEQHYFLGTQAMNADELDVAEEQLRRAVELEPNHSDAHNHLGIVYSRRRDLASATAQFERAVETNPRSVTARTNLARLYAAQGRPDDALAEFEEAVRRDPYDLDARRHYGLTLLAVHRLDDAAEQLRIVVASRPDDLESRRALERALQPIAPH